LNLVLKQDKGKRVIFVDKHINKYISEGLYMEAISIYINERSRQSSQLMCIFKNNQIAPSQLPYSYLK